MCPNLMQSRDASSEDIEKVLTTPRLIEIVGPAGAGKTTLGHALCTGIERCIEAKRLRIRSFRNAPYCLSHALFLTPTWFRLARKRCQLSREEVKKMLYLKGWYRVLENQWTHPDHIIIIDQGPLFNLATLHGFGPTELKTRQHDNWWNSMFVDWATTLDAIVWLDGPDDVLIDRINSRIEFHMVKNSPNSDAERLLAAYRSAYDYVLSALTAHRDIRIMQFDTSQHSPQFIVSQLAKRW